MSTGWYYLVGGTILFLAIVAFRWWRFQRPPQIRDYQWLALFLTFLLDDALRNAHDTLRAVGSEELSTIYDRWRMFAGLLGVIIILLFLSGNHEDTADANDDSVAQSRC